MKYLYTFTLVTLVTLLSFGQRIVVTKGPVLDPKEIRKDIDLPRIVLGRFSYSVALFFNPMKKKTYTGFGYKDKAFHFAVLEDYLKYSGVKKLTSETINDRVTLQSFVIVNNKMYVLYSMKFPEQNSFSVYVNEVSEDMVVLGSPIVLQTYKNLKDEGMNVSVLHSRDKKHILITRFCDSKPKQKQKMECKVIDGSFSEIWSRTIELEGMNKENNLRSIDVDNEGNLYCLVEHSINYVPHPVAYSYFWKSKSLKNFKLGLNTGENFGTSLELLNGEKPYIVGLNEEKKKLTYFIHRIDVPSETVISLGSGLMPAEFYKTSSFRVFSTKDWSVSNMISLSNNTIVASVEAILVDSKYHQHHSYNTYVLAFREDGSQAWARTIQKKQSTIQGLAGHILIPANDNVLVIYNDNEENIKKKPEDPKVEGFQTKDGMTVVQEIDPSGKVTKYPMMKDPELKSYMIFFNGTARIEDGLYYAPCMAMKSAFSVNSRNIVFQVK